MRGSVATEQDSRLNLTWNEHSRASVKFASENEDESAGHNSEGGEEDDDVSIYITPFSLHFLPCS